MITTELDIAAVKQAARNIFCTDIELERVSSGLSTYVYRIQHDEKTYYLRALPEDASFAAEAKAHEIMSERGVSLPKVLFYEHKNLLVDKSLMLTSEIPGRCVSHGDTNISGVLFDAGKQLAVINSVKVTGFGWIDRDIHNTLTGKNLIFEEYFYETLYRDIDSLQQYGFDPDYIKALLDGAYPILDITDSSLVHGDFDYSHIYHLDNQYTGIIDFGEIRGSHYLYDLGHFKLHDENNGFQYLAKGYNEIRKLTEDDYIKIDLLALFVGLGRSKYEHYRKLIQKQLDIIKNKM